MEIGIYLPNLLAGARLLAGPLYLLLGTVPASAVTLALLGVAALTDAFDGRLARYFGATSGFGAALDTTADKIFVLALLLKLAIAGTVPRWLFWVAAGEYLIIAIEGSLYLTKFSLVPVPDMAARVSSILAVATVLIGLDPTLVSSTAIWIT